MRQGLCVSRIAGSAHGLSLPTLLEAVALPVHLQDVNSVSEAVQQGAGQPLRAEDLGPLVEGQVGGDQDRPSLVSLAEDLEEELRAGLGEWDEAKLVDDQQLESGKPLLEVEQSSLIPGFDQLVDQTSSSCGSSSIVAAFSVWSLFAVLALASMLRSDSSEAKQQINQKLEALSDQICRLREEHSGSDAQCVGHGKCSTESRKTARWLGVYRNIRTRRTPPMSSPSRASATRRRKAESRGRKER